MAVALMRERHRERFVIILRRVSHVTTLGTERDVVILERHQARYAEAGARPEHAEHAAGECLAAADLDDLARLQTRQTHRQRSEVVDHQECLQLEVAAHRFDRKFPIVIGQLDPVAGDRIGERKRRVAYRRRAVLIEECTCCGLERFVAFDRHHLGGPQAPGRRLQSKTSVGRTDVGEQPQAVGVDHLVE